MDNVSIDAAVRKADALAKQGAFGDAISTLLNVLDEHADHVQSLTMLSRIFRANQETNKAIDLLIKLSGITPNDSWIWFDLAESYEALDDFENAAAAYLKAWKLDRRNARFALNAGFALWRDKQMEAALSVWSIGADMDPLVRTAQFRKAADDATRIKSRTADAELRRHFTQMYTTGLADHGSPERLTTAIWPQTHFGPVSYNIENQKPYMFYAPDLPVLPVFDTTDLSWAKTLKQATPNIVAELNAYLAQTNDYGSPYLAHMSDGEESWKSLQGSEDWNALHLFKDAQKEDCTEAFPKTLSALKDIPLVELFGTPMEVFFSVLKPGTHIPPHFGLSNSRLTAHLPLIIPKDCEIRVADHVHHWRAGELFLFDDSFDHEAKNDSSDIRIVLIFETWRPDLSAVEISALQHSMEARTTWLNNRAIPDLKLM